MESNCREESINSSEEINQSEQESIDLGVGRSYECVFCKRGFNTAQALGGHMNIHRKDRARNKPNPGKQEHLYTGPRFYQPIVPPPPPSISTDQQSNSHRFASPEIFAYFPEASTSGIGALYGNYSYHHHQQFMSVDSDRDDRQQSDPLVPEDWSVSLRFDQKEELDLELRLGYDS